MQKRHLRIVEVSLNLNRGSCHRRAKRRTTSEVAAAVVEEE